MDQIIKRIYFEASDLYGFASYENAEDYASVNGFDLINRHVLILLLKICQMHRPKPFVKLFYRKGYLMAVLNVYYTPEYSGPYRLHISVKLNPKGYITYLKINPLPL